MKIFFLAIILTFCIETSCAISLIVFGRVYSYDGNLLQYDSKVDFGKYYVIAYFNGSQEPNYLGCHGGKFQGMDWINKLTTPHGDTLRNISCMCDNHSINEIKTVRIEIISLGHKVYSKNIVNLIKTGNWHYSIDLNKINLVQSDLPRIEQVIHSYYPDSTNYFRITLKNSFNKDILIKNLLIKAIIDNGNQQCMGVPNSDFTISDEIRIRTSKEGGMVLEGTYKENGQNANISLPIKGNIYVNNCAKTEYLSLQLTTDLIIPKDDYVNLSISIPKNLKIINSTYRGGSGSPPLSQVENGKLNRFKKFEFAFTTNLEKELDLLIRINE